MSIIYISFVFKKRLLGAPAIKQLYIQLKKDEKLLVLFAHFLVCKV